MTTYAVYEVTRDGSIFIAKQRFTTEQEANQWISEHQSDSDYRYSELFIEREER